MKSHHSGKLRHARGFTLIELVVTMPWLPSLPVRRCLIWARSSTKAKPGPRRANSNPH
ncbi:MAG: prepilin-type N-terminal cleavage/methylation domain-containing protein [Gammaproteobacteria bacterium]|nr:prepilin-type N-terminal cleavage/methylation domain-containing protein [Gammaproteobacteria bacterium]